MMRALLLAALLPALALAGCTGSEPGGPRGDVGMPGVRFEPQNLTVHVGQRVVWANNGSLAHTVTSDEPGGPLASGQVLPEQTYAVTFARAGVFDYHCIPHAYREGDQWTGMVGTVTVLP